MTNHHQLGVVNATDFEIEISAPGVGTNLWRCRWRRREIIFFNRHRRSWNSAAVDCRATSSFHGANDDFGSVPWTRKQEPVRGNQRSVPGPKIEISSIFRSNRSPHSKFFCADRFFSDFVISCGQCRLAVLLCDRIAWCKSANDRLAALFSRTTCARP